MTSSIEVQPPQSGKPEPDTVTVSAGENVSLGTPTRPGETPRLFSWLKNGKPINGANQSTLKIPNVTGCESAGYSLFAANADESRIRFAVDLIVKDPDVSVDQPQLAKIGERVVLEAKASGSGSMSFQWSRNGTPIRSAKGENLIFESVQPEDSGIYTVEVSNAFGTAFSEPVAVLIPPQITPLPETIGTKTGEPITLNIDAKGSAPIQVRWCRDGSLMEGATGSQLILHRVDSEARIRAVVSSPAGRIETATQLQIIPHIHRQPESVTVSRLRTDIAFELGASGTGPLKYQWFQDDRPVPHADGPRLLVKQAVRMHAGEYRCKVTGPAGHVLSDAAVLTIEE